MKKTLSLILIITLSFFLFSCPEPEETTSGITTLTYSGTLSFGEWLGILEDIYDQKNFVNLDLSSCSVSNTGGSAFIDYVHHGKSFKIFNALPWLTNPTDINFSEEALAAKNKIVSIILPKSATMIDYSQDGQSSSAFRDFIYLRSVTGENIEVVGSYAFYGLKNLRDVNFPFAGIGVSAPPAVHPASEADVTPINGYFAHIDDFAFAECSRLARISFPHARIIGRSAFENSGLISISISDLPSVWIIYQGAFRGCKDLTSVSFRSVTKIGNEAFANSGLKTASFTANLLRPFTTGYPIISGLKVVYDSVIFYERAFIGSKSLQRLEVPNAWNVYFAADSLANIGTHLDLQLFDHDQEYDGSGINSHWHPQIEDYLGDRTSGTGTHPRTINSVTLILPSIEDEEQSHVMYFADETVDGKKIGTIYKDLHARYGEGAIKVTVQRY